MSFACSKPKALRSPAFAPQLEASRRGKSHRVVFGSPHPLDESSFEDHVSCKAMDASRRRSPRAGDRLLASLLGTACRLAGWVGWKLSA